MKILWVLGLGLGILGGLGAQSARVWEVWDPGYDPKHRKTTLLEMRSGDQVRQGKIILLGGHQVLYFYQETLGFLPDTVTAPQSPQVMLRRLPDRDFEPRDPIPLDLGSLSTFNSQAWRRSDWELFRWNLFPGVLMMEARDYQVLDRYLKRMTFFVEKAGFRGTLMENEEMTDKFGWRGYDYGVEDLARFYNLARETQFDLNPEEIELRELLVELGLLKRVEQKILPGVGALIGYLRETPWSYKKILLPHEAAHGVYFIKPSYRAKVWKVWESLPKVHRELWLRFLRGNTSTTTEEHRRRGETPIPYDTTYEELMANEFQAYWLQQNREAWGAFIDQMLRVIALEDPEWEAKYLGAKDRTKKIQMDAGDQIQKAYKEEAGLDPGFMKSLELIPLE